MTHRRLKLIGIVLILVIAVGLTCAGSVPQSLPANDIAALTSSDMLRLTEALRLLTTHGDTVWPGWKQTPPLLLRSGGYDYLVGHPAPPAGFTLIPDVSIDRLIVFRHPDHLVPVPAATTWQVADRWSVAIPIRDEFQRAIDEALGTGVVDLDDAAYVRTIVHEAFHVHQMTLMNGKAPDFGSKIEEREAMQLLARIADLDRLHTLEGQALRSSIEAESIEGARQAAAQFVQLRRERLSKYPEVAAFEQSLEWAEGLARYADVRLMQLAATDDASSIMYSDDAWGEFLTQLSDPASIPTSLRDRYAAFGAAQALLLDRLMPDWKTRALPGGASLDNLVSLSISPPDQK